MIPLSLHLHIVQISKICNHKIFISLMPIVEFGREDTWSCDVNFEIKSPLIRTYTHKKGNENEHIRKFRSLYIWWQGSMQKVMDMIGSIAGALSSIFFLEAQSVDNLAFWRISIKERNLLILGCIFESAR